MEEKEVAAEQQVTAPVDDVTRQQSEQLKAQWEQYAQAFSKSLPTSSPYFSGGIPFPLLPNPYLFQAAMQYKLAQPFLSPGTTTTEVVGTSDKNSTDREKRERKVNVSDESQAAQQGRAVGLETVEGMESRKEEDMEKSSALALLATTAGDHIHLPEKNWKGAQQAAKRAYSSQLDRQDSGIETVDPAILAGMDERDVKRLRRKQSNRESARRSRLRKQAECEQLQQENARLKAEVNMLRNDQLVLKAEVSVLEAKLRCYEKTQGAGESKRKK